MARISTPTLIELAAPDDSLSTLDLTDVNHPVNIKGLSGKRAGMACMIGTEIYMATGGDPSDEWILISNKFPSGWELYTDGQYTSGSPLVVTAGTSAALTNDSSSKIQTYAPIDGSLYDSVSNRITPNTLGSEVTARITFRASGSINNAGFSVSADISEAGDGSITVASVPVRMLRGQNTTALYTVTLDMFALDTFIANGARLRVTAEDGNITLYDISFFIKKP